MSLFRTLKCFMSTFRISYFPHCTFGKRPLTLQPPKPLGFSLSVTSLRSFWVQQAKQP